MDQLVSLETKKQLAPNANLEELGKALNLSKTHVHYLSTIKLCFDQPGLEKVRLAAQENPPYTLSFACAKAMAGLKGRLSDPSGAVYAVLDLIISHMYALTHIKT